MGNSRIPGFYKLSISDRLKELDERVHFTEDEWKILTSDHALPIEKANNMVENAIGVYPLPFGVGLNFTIDGKDYLVPMAIEEPSVIASSSHIAKIVREAGGFHTETTGRLMTGQIQLVGCSDPEDARKVLLDHEQLLLDQANSKHPGMLARGGGAKKMEVRLFEDAEGYKYSNMIVIHLYIDTCDAMGANTINTMVESVAPTVEQLTGGKIYLRILSNYTDSCLARSHCVIPPRLLSTGTFTGEEVRDGVIAAYEFAARDIYRAVTHNKGVMNGVDAVVMATGNDWRAIEAAAHAHAARFGRYGSMTEWSIDDAGNLVGSLELPMPVGIIGGATRIHPTASLSQKLLNVSSATELASVIVSVGLAQNLGALKALATDGIQKGHMALHARSVAMAAGAQGDLVEKVARGLQEANDFRIEKARELLECF